MVYNGHSHKKKLLCQIFFHDNPISSEVVTIQCSQWPLDAQSGLGAKHCHGMETAGVSHKSTL